MSVDSATAPRAADYQRSGHNQAANCEIFIDAAKSQRSSHDIQLVKLFIKTLNDRLDGAIVEVGIQGPDGHYRAHPFMGAAKDYFELEVEVGNTWSGPLSKEGAVYVKTDQGTYYWTNPFGKDTNFKLTRTLFWDLESRIDIGERYNGRRDTAVATQDASFKVESSPDSFQPFNPQNCR